MNAHAHSQSPALRVDVDGEGPPLVLLHGWAMHSGLWGPLAAKLASRYRVHTVDLPGHGYNAAAGPFALEASAAAIDAAVGPTDEPYTVIGWSLGGQVAMRWAKIAPSRVARLVLVCTTPRFVEGDDWPHAMSRETLSRFGDELRVAWRLTVQRFLSLQLMGAEDGRALLSELRREIFARGEPSRSGLESALRALQTADLRDDVASIAQPAIVIAGDRDTLTPAGAQRWLAERLPNGHFAWVEGAAHVPFLSHPAAFDAALEGFLAASHAR